MARADVFHFTERWQLFRSLFNDKPDLDTNLSRLDQRDQQLERFLGDIWNPQVREYTPTITNVSNQMGVFSYQIVNASLVYVEGYLGPPPLQPPPYPTATATGVVTASLPFTPYVGGQWGPAQAPFPVTMAGTNYGGYLDFNVAQLTITQASGANIAIGTALTGLAWAGVYRAIVS